MPLIRTRIDRLMSLLIGSGIWRFFRTFGTPVDDLVFCAVVAKLMTSIGEIMKFWSW